MQIEYISREFLPYLTIPVLLGVHTQPPGPAHSQEVIITGTPRITGMFHYNGRGASISITEMSHI
jgi:hypothetical protein